MKLLFYFYAVTRKNIPTYAIVELLIRLSHINPLIGDYKGHLIFDGGVIVKTNMGNISFSMELIQQQFDMPEVITEDDLKALGDTFKPFK